MLNGITNKKKIYAHVSDNESRANGELHNHHTYIDLKIYNYIILESKFPNKIFRMA